MIITDLALAEIRSHIASHRPERGGALYGPKGQFAVTHFEFDAEGATSAVSYVPSRRLIDNVRAVELQTGLQLKGIVHSHPLGFAKPSQGDIQTVQSFFRLNPHFSRMELPIVQQIGANEPQDSAGFIKWFNAARGAELASSFGLGSVTSNKGPSVEIISDDLFVIPLLKDANELAQSLASRGIDLKVDPKVQHLKIQNASLIGLVTRNDQMQEFMFFVGYDYPVMPPVVLYQEEGNTCQLEFIWNGLEHRNKALQNIAVALFNKLRVGGVVAIPSP